MRRTWVIAVIVVLVVIGAWLSFGISAVFSAERDVLARLDDLALSYVSMDTEYVQPLIATSPLPDADRATLADVSAKLQALGRSKNANDTFKNLVAAQRATIAFFTTPGFSAEFTSDPRYVNWNRNASNLGEASSLIRDYNVALALYNERLRSPAGRIARYWSTIDNRSYLGIDGTLQDKTHVSF